MIGLRSTDEFRDDPILWRAHKALRVAVTITCFAVIRGDIQPLRKGITGLPEDSGESDPLSGRDRYFIE